MIRGDCNTDPPKLTAAPRVAKIWRGSKNQGLLMMFDARAAMTAVFDLFCCMWVDDLSEKCDVFKRAKMMNKYLLPYLLRA
jgi:hypothetical protein